MEKTMEHEMEASVYGSYRACMLLWSVCILIWPLLLLEFCDFARQQPLYYDDFPPPQTCQQEDGNPSGHADAPLSFAWLPHMLRQMLLNV